jgi:hypothetical protein
MSGRLVLGERAGSERGSVLVLTTLFLTVLLGMTMIVFDLGALRGNVRVDQSIADLGALAAGPGLGANNPTAACTASANYISTNAKLAIPINASSFCKGMGTTVCSLGGSGQATPTTSVGKYTVSIHYPVPDTEIQDPNIVGGARLYDSIPCQRMRVIIGSTDDTLFAGMFGTPTLSGTRSATVKASAVGPRKTPALWLLDPTGCTALSASGGSQVTVGTPAVPGGTPAVPGVLTIDSDGSGCSSNQHTISSSGSGSLITSVPTSGADPGLIQLFGLPLGATSCGGTACDPSDVSGTPPRISPQPTPVANRATRSRIDDVYNCQSAYPDYHGITLIPNCDPSSTPAYIKLLKTAVGAGPGAPSTGTWTTIGPGGGQCSPNASITYPVGNYYVKCTSGNGFVLSGVTVTFSGGNVVFEGSVIVSNGGVLNLNFVTANTNPALASNCKAPVVQTPCIGSSSAQAAIVYFRGSNTTSFSTSGSGAVNANHVFVYGGTGSVGFSGNAPVWTAPTEGPFVNLAYWTDMPATASNAERSSFTITGGSGANLVGVFFTPEASPFKLTGGGNWGAQHAQFISYQLDVTGGGIFTMAPDPDHALNIQLQAGRLIR